MELISQLTEPLLIKALNRLGDLLKEKGKSLELTCCGGVVSVLYHHSRAMTHDVDVIFPNNPQMVALLHELVDAVGQELHLQNAPHDKWFNDGVSFFGLRTKSDTVVFRHTHLVLKAADWHEMLAHKLTAFRSARDISDAVGFLREIRATDQAATLAQVNRYRPSSPLIADDVFQRRFEQVWKQVHGG